MKFDVQELDRDYLAGQPQVGDVYAARGGPPTIAWVVVAINDTGRTAYLLGIDRNGDVCSTVSYSIRVLEERPLIGRIDMSGMVFHVRRVARA